MTRPGPDGESEAKPELVSGPSWSDSVCRPARQGPLAGGQTFTDHRHLVVYGQRTADDRLVFGGRGAPYHFRSRIEPEFDRDERVFSGLRAAARDLHLAALVVPTLSGRSARLLSAHRPQVPILALSPGRETVRRCALMWGVQAASMRRHEITEALIADAARRVVELGGDVLFHGVHREGPLEAKVPVVHGAPVPRERVRRGDEVCGLQRKASGVSFVAARHRTFTLVAALNRNSLLLCTFGVWGDDEVAALFTG